FLTYDEHGGTFDHVPPPPASPPDDFGLQSEEPEGSLIVQHSNLLPGGFDRYGMRVPLTVVSPFAKPSFVSHRIYDHTSITRFIDTRFKLPALPSRDANADPLLDFFDFNNRPFLQPPSIPEPPIDSAKLHECRLLFGSSP